MDTVASDWACCNGYMEGHQWPRQWPTLELLTMAFGHSHWAMAIDQWPWQMPLAAGHGQRPWLHCTAFQFYFFCLKCSKLQFHELEVSYLRAEVAPDCPDMGSDVKTLVYAVLKSDALNLGGGPSANALCRS